MLKKMLSYVSLNFQISHETADWPDGDLHLGMIKAYWEQGMEGAFDYVFVPDKEPHLANGGRGYFLKSGDFLRIFANDGSIIWEGELHFINTRLTQLFRPDRHHLPNQVWSYQKQEGVSYSDWVSWFWASPSLKAEFLEGGHKKRS